jgi:Bacterial signalling protein N terminal repeat
MHFVAMLAFIMPTPMSYDIGLTTLSLVVAIFVRNPKTRPRCLDSRLNAASPSLTNASNDRPHHLRGGPGTQIIAPPLEVALVRSSG